MSDSLQAALTPAFQDIYVFRWVRENANGSVGFAGQVIYSTLKSARTNVHKFKHYSTGTATSHIIIFSCHTDTGEWQVEHMFPQGTDLSILPWHKGYKEIG